MWPGPATGLGAVGTPGPRPRTGPRGGRPSLGRFLRPARWPPARPFPIARRRPRDRSDEGWAGSARPAGPKAPGSAGELCPREQLEAAAWKQGVACALFLQAGQRAAAGGCGMRPRPGAWPPPNRASLKGLTRGRANSCRPQALSGPAPGMRGVAAPAPSRGSPRACFPGWALECSRGAADSRAPVQPRPHSWCEPGQPASFFHAPVPAAAGSGEGRGRFL